MNCECLGNWFLWAHQIPRSVVIRLPKTCLSSITGVASQSNCRRQCLIFAVCAGNYNPLERVIKAASNDSNYSWCTCSEEICTEQLRGFVQWNMNGNGWKGACMQSLAHYCVHARSLEHKSAYIMHLLGSAQPIPVLALLNQTNLRRMRAGYVPPVDGSSSSRANGVSTSSQ